MWGHLEDRRWDRGFLGVGDCGKDSLLNFLVALDRLVLFGLPELLQLIEVAMDGVPQGGEVVWQKVGVRQPYDRCPCRLRERASVAEIGIGEMCVPVKIVVDGVIDSAAVFVAVAQIERSNAEVIKEYCPVGS